MSFLDTLIYGYRTILAAGVAATRRNSVNFIDFTATDNPTTGATDMTYTGGGGGGGSTVNGATVPAAGALTTGNVLQVSGVSALSYAPVNLAGGVDYVTGIVPVLNGGTGLSSLASGIATWFGAPSSANLLAAMSDKTGTGLVVFQTAPSFKTSIHLNNPADTFTYTITPAAIVANRVLNLPLLLATDTMVCEAFAQTLTNKTINGANNTLFVRLGNDVTGILPVANGGTNQSSLLTSMSGGAGTNNIDWSTAPSFTKTLASGANTITFSNRVAGMTILVRFTSNAGGSTVTWPTVKWPGGVVPTQTPTGIDIYSFYYDGTDTFGTLTQAYA